jgi:hypothetical protein
MTTITVHSPSKVAAPRAAAWAANLFSAFATWMQRTGAERSEATRRHSQLSDRSRDAAALRSYAMRFAAHDPRFAADLMAAADRHEQ